MLLRKHLKLLSVQIAITCLVVSGAYAQQPLDRPPAVAWLDMAAKYPSHTPDAKAAQELAFDRLFSRNINVLLFQYANDKGPLEAVSVGKVDLAVVPSVLLAEKSPKFAVFDLPFFFKDPNEVVAFQQTGLGDVLLDSLASQGLVGIGYWNTGANHLFGMVLDDFKGGINTIYPLTIWSSTSSIGRESLEAHGMQFADPVLTTTGLSGPEEANPTLFSYAHKAGHFNLVDFSASMAYEKVTKGTGEYSSFPTTLSPMIYRPTVSVVVANRTSWNKLPIRLQWQLVQEVRSQGLIVTSKSLQDHESAIAALLHTRFTLSSSTDVEVFKLSTSLEDEHNRIRQISKKVWRSGNTLNENGFLDAAEAVLAELTRFIRRSLGCDSKDGDEAVGFA